MDFLKKYSIEDPNSIEDNLIKENCFDNILTRSFPVNEKDNIECHFPLKKIHQSKLPFKVIKMTENDLVYNNQISKLESQNNITPIYQETISYKENCIKSDFTKDINNNINNNFVCNNFNPCKYKVKYDYDLINFIDYIKNQSQDILSLRQKFNKIRYNLEVGLYEY